MTDEGTRQTILDEEHLRLLSIGYYISAGFLAFFSLFSLFYFVMGIILTIAAQSSHSTISPGEPPPEFVGVMFIGIGLIMFVLMILGAALKLVAGLRIRQRKSRIFCMIIAGIACLEFPYGTLLSIFTFMVLGRCSVRTLFKAAPEIPGEARKQP